MAEYRVTVTAELKVSAESEAEAVKIARSSFIMGSNTKLMAPLDITDVKLLRQVDRRLLSQLPNLPQERVQALLLELSDIEQTIIVLCVEPQWSHHVFTIIRKAHPTIELSEIARAITHLSNEGWLHSLAHHIDQDSFPNIGVNAQHTINSKSAR